MEIRDEVYITIPALTVDWCTMSAIGTVGSRQSSVVSSERIPAANGCQQRRSMPPLCMVRFATKRQRELADLNNSIIQHKWVLAETGLCSLFNSVAFAFALQFISTFIFAFIAIAQIRQMYSFPFTNVGRQYNFIYRLYQI